jgi:hypothetical protein
MQAGFYQKSENPNPTRSGAKIITFCFYSTGYQFNSLYF